jgi:hypothetical protein
MKKAYLLLFIVSAIYAQPMAPTGFQNVPFGTTMKQAIDLLMKNDSEVTLQEFDDFLSIKYFSIGDRYTNVYLNFNKYGKFYSYSFNSDSYSASEFDSRVIDDAIYFSKIFQKKFGNPIVKNKPQFLNIKQGFVTYFWKWGFKKYSIYTAFSEHESEYFAIATVIDKAMEKELENQINKQEDESAKKAAESF